MRLRDLYAMTRRVPFAAAFVRLLSDDGWSAAQIAELMNVDERTVRRYRSQGRALDTCTPDTCCPGVPRTPAVRGTNVSLLSYLSATDVADVPTTTTPGAPNRVETCYTRARELAGLPSLALRPFEVALAAELDARGTFKGEADEALVAGMARTIRELRARDLAVSLRSVANRHGETWRPLNGSRPGGPVEVSAVPAFDAAAHRRWLEGLTAEGAGPQDP